MIQSKRRIEVEYRGVPQSTCVSEDPFGTQYKSPSTFLLLVFPTMSYAESVNVMDFYLVTHRSIFSSPKTTFLRTSMIFSSSERDSSLRLLQAFRTGPFSKKKSRGTL